MTTRLAIVGMACRYPDATTPAELWESVLAQRRAFRPIPPERLSAADYVSFDPRASDHTYVKYAGLIEGWEFDRGAFRVAGNTYRSADMSHWLALDVARLALEDAGFPNADGLPRVTTGVLVGNTLTGEFSRAALMRLRWPYVRRVVEAALSDEGWDQRKRKSFLSDLESQYKRPFPEQGDETLAGGLSNTIAGRICNYYDLGGGGYTVDGACSSSLLSLATACSALTTKDIDVALVGGVDLSLDPFELVGFARLGALAHDEMRVFDADATGFLPGEGCGFVVLMREQDALAQGKRIYGVIRGWGISSDGSGGLTRPEVPGQKLALKRAYHRAGYGIGSVAYFEGHGTGTGIGDTVELSALTEAIREQPDDGPLPVVGSVKANIGHTKAAAGLAGLLKATMAVHSQIIPPNTACHTPHPILTESAPALRTSPEGCAWPAKKPLRAGVSSMGFGGINVHVTLEGPETRPQKRIAPTVEVMLRSPQDSELFLLAATDREDMERQIDSLASLAPKLSFSQLADLSSELARTLHKGPLRAAVVAGGPNELKMSAEVLHGWIRDGVRRKADTLAGVFLGDDATPPVVTFLFPGQAAPAYLDGGAMRRRFNSVARLYDAAQLPLDADGVHTSIAQPAIVTSSAAALRLLADFNVTAEYAVGHSLGELTALHWGKVFDADTLRRIAFARGRAMTDHCTATGAMASIGADERAVSELLKGVEVVIAGLNAPDQTVVSGLVEGVEAVIESAQQRGLRAVRLPVSHAFHSSLLAGAGQELARHLETEAFRPLRSSVVSTIVGRPLTDSDDLKSLLCSQVTSPVRFREALIEACKRADLVIEVGPGMILGNLAATQVNVPVISTDAGSDSLRGILQAVGAAFAFGAPADPSALHGDRFCRPLALDWQPRFLTNPCEWESSEGVATEASAVAPVADGSEEPADVFTVVQRLVAERTELPLDNISADDRLLDDLHLNSLQVTRIVVEAARRLHLPPITAPNRFAAATVAQVVEALEQLKEIGGSPSMATAPGSVPGVESWVRFFTVESVPKPLPPLQSSSQPGKWRLFAPKDHVFAEALARELDGWGDVGVIICLPPAPDLSHIGLMLEGAKAALDAQGPARLVFVQHGGGAASLARTIHLEADQLSTCVVDVPYAAESLPWAIAEAKAAVGYSEAHYDDSGVRRVPRLSLLPSASLTEEHLSLSSDDLLLVSGGGKGIAAECALNLARETGAGLVLMGRSQPSKDQELAANLNRFSSMGVRFRYVAADVTRREEVLKVLRDVQRDMGEITGILHAAGTNVPQLLGDLDEDAFRRTLAPKLLGAQNLLEGVARDRLRLFATFGSIIARTGMRGEADYAVANEWMTGLTERFQADHPACKCAAIEWSVWAGVGMGEKLGRIENLEAEGITAIPLETGIAAAKTLLSCRLPRVSVVVAGRLGAPPTLSLAESQLPLLRFLEQKRVFYPGIELVCDADLTLEKDPYFRDHVFRGQRLLPAVMGLEAMAQAAMAVAGEGVPPMLRDVQFDRPVVLPESGTLSLRVAALVKESKEIEVVVRSEETAFSVNHFRATCSFDGSAQVRGLDDDLPRDRAEVIPLGSDSDLYRHLLFQGDRFRRVRGYRHITATECVAELIPDAAVDWFAPFLPRRLVLGDPGLRDATIHAIQACVPDIALLPVGVEGLLLEPEVAAGVRLVHAVERSQQDGLFVYDVEVLGEDGRTVERWEKLQLRTIAGTERSGDWLAPLVGPYFERKVEQLIPGAQVAAVVDVDSEMPRPDRTDRAISRALCRQVPIVRRPDGKPEVLDAVSVSAAHAAHMTFSVASSQAVACDVELVADHPDSVRSGMLTPQRNELVEAVQRETGEEKAVVATRVWAVTECLTKIGAAADTPVMMQRMGQGRWVVFSCGRLTAATTALPVAGCKSPVVFAVMVQGDHASL